MRRITAGLVGAMLALAPMIAVAGPDDERDADSTSNQRVYKEQNQQDQTDTYEESIGQTRLGIIVLGMTEDLRMYFAAPRDRGVLVARVEPNSLAQRAGVHVGDILIGVDTRTVRAGDDVLQAVSEGRDRLRLYIVRDHRPMRLDAIMRAAPQNVPYRPGTST
jgi:C-terminal processing protease CtpA/Prc